jgi:hypothetical protein
MKNLHWGNHARAKPEIRAAGSLDKAGRITRALHQRVKYERSLASSAAREAHLRSLMGLAAARSSLLDKEEGSK